ncbi:MAG: AmmeMemoRadiSam system protein B [Elusimicrobiota bacterium]
MSSTSDLPKPIPALRADTEAFPIEQEGRSMIVLQDPEGIAGQSLALSPSAMLLASLLDGRRTASELISMAAKDSGTLLAASEIERLAARLEEAGFLETPAVREARRRILEDFLAGSGRKARMRGTGYPEGGLELASFMGKFFQDSKGPGRPLPDKPSRSAPPLGLVAPHIDLQRGGASYAWSYGALAECPPPDLVVALGVAHQSPNSPWTFTRKDYETPYGPMKVDGELYDELRGALWYDPTDDEWVHRREHSLEFQALWLKFLWKDAAPPWVPILTSTFERFSPDKAPSTVSTVEDAVSEMGRRLAALSKKKRILVLAGVDLAHVGPHFGDELEPGPELSAKVEAEDRASLAHALKLEADAFYLSTVKDGHWRKVCGLSALYTALRLIQAMEGKNAPGAGELLSYGQAPDPRGGIVSFAGAVFR